MNYIGLGVITGNETNFLIAAVSLGGDVYFMLKEGEKEISEDEDGNRTISFINTDFKEKQIVKVFETNDPDGLYHFEPSEIDLLPRDKKNWMSAETGVYFN